MVRNSRTSRSSICVTLILYVLQGISIGITNSIPLFLIYYGATWKDRGIFNFSFYPFSFKLLWAPLIDVLYIKKFGRRKSWIIPIQLIMTIILLLLSFYIEPLVINNRVILLTIIFTSIIFLTATEDICIDGLAITLFAATNPQWASTSQTIGQTCGRFLGTSFLMTFESANFTNKFIREPLSLSAKTSGLFSLGQFVLFAAIAFFIVTIYIIVFVREQQEVLTDNSKEKNDLSLIKTYLSTIRLLKEKCVQQLTFVSLIGPMGLVATNYMTHLELISQGVPRETLALVNIPVTIITIIAPLIIRHTERPLIWYARSYVMYLINAIPIVIFVYFTPRIISYSYYYPILILLLSANEFINTLRFTGQLGFFAYISDPRIGGTHMTFHVTLHNLGFAVNSSILFYIADRLPKKYAFPILVGSCVFLGIIWFTLSFRMLIKLQNLPIHKWYVTEEIITDDKTTSKEQEEKDHYVSLIPNKTVEQID